MPMHEPRSFGYICRHDRKYIHDECASGNYTRWMIKMIRLRDVEPASVCYFYFSSMRIDEFHIT